MNSTQMDKSPSLNAASSAPENASASSTKANRGEKLMTAIGLAGALALIAFMALIAFL